MVKKNTLQQKFIFIILNRLIIMAFSCDNLQNFSDHENKTITTIDYLPYFEQMSTSDIFIW